MRSPLIYTLIIYLFYLLSGGFIFYVLESADILDLTKFISDSKGYRKDIIDKLLKSGYTSQEIDDVAKKLHIAQKQHFINDEFIETGPIWEMYNAFFFVTTLVTTIGYGNVTPKTSLGFIFCIVYIIIGIPLNMNVMGSLAELHGERLIQLLNDPVLPAMKSKFHRIFFRVRDFLNWFVLLLVFPTIGYVYTENWTFLEGLYYSFTTLTTVGFGDYVAGWRLPKNEFYAIYKVFVFVWLLIGVSFTLLVVNYVTHYFVLRWTYACVCDGRRMKFVKVRFTAELFDYHDMLFKSEKSLESYRQEEIEFFENRRHQIQALSDQIGKLRTDFGVKVHDIQNKREELAHRLVKKFRRR